MADSEATNQAISQATKATVMAIAEGSDRGRKPNAGARQVNTAEMNRQILIKTISVQLGSQRKVTELKHSKMEVTFFYISLLKVLRREIIYHQNLARLGRAPIHTNASTNLPSYAQQ